MFLQNLKLYVLEIFLLMYFLIQIIKNEINGKVVWLLKLNKQISLIKKNKFNSVLTQSVLKYSSQNKKKIIKPITQSPEPKTTSSTSSINSGNSGNSPSPTGSASSASSASSDDLLLESTLNQVNKANLKKNFVNKNSSGLIKKLTMIPTDTVIMAKTFFPIDKSLINIINESLCDDQLETLRSYISVKNTFYEIFQNIPNNYNEFIKYFLKYPDNKICNCGIKFYSTTNKKYVWIKILNFKLIQITSGSDIKSYDYIERKLKKNSIFITRDNEQIVFSCGNVLSMENNKSNIKKILTNTSTLLVKNLLKYEQIKIIYWISSY